MLRLARGASSITAASRIASFTSLQGTSNIPLGQHIVWVNSVVVQSARSPDQQCCNSCDTWAW